MWYLSHSAGWSWHSDPPNLSPGPAFFQAALPSPSSSGRQRAVPPAKAGAGPTASLKLSPFLQLSKGSSAPPLLSRRAQCLGVDIYSLTRAVSRPASQDEPCLYHLPPGDPCTGRAQDTALDVSRAGKQLSRSRTPLGLIASVAAARLLQARRGPAERSDCIPMPGPSPLHTSCSPVLWVTHPATIHLPAILL